MNGKQTKKLRKLVNKSYPKLYSNLEQALLNMPFKERLKAAVLIVLKRKPGLKVKR